MFRFLVALLLVSALPAAAAPINVGNFVWEDINGDGVQDAGEPGMAGATVQLWDGAKTSLLDSATTNASGNYSLVAPAQASTACAYCYQATLSRSARRIRATTRSTATSTRTVR